MRKIKVIVAAMLIVVGERIEKWLEIAPEFYLYLYLDLHLDWDLHLGWDWIPFQ